jgi:hypothetical protein
VLFGDALLSCPIIWFVFTLSSFIHG